MDKAEQIRRLLDERMNMASPPATLLAIVQSVNEIEMTCTLYDEETELEYYDVRLRPVIDGNEGLIVFPKTGTWCLAARLENTDEWMVIGCSEVDKWQLKIGETTIEQDAAGLLIKKQNDTLRQAVELIIEAVMKIIVIQGQNPDYVKLQQALAKIQNLLK